MANLFRSPSLKQPRLKPVKPKRVTPNESPLQGLGISRLAVKSRCAGEWGGWGRLSEDGPGQHNPDPSEGPWGGGRPTLQAGPPPGHRPGPVRANPPAPEGPEGGRQTAGHRPQAGAGLSPLLS